MTAVTTHSTAQTEEAAAALSPYLKDGDVLLLHGGLGAGKTAFVRGLVRGLGGDENEVSSPTFALMNQYEGRLTVYHFDLYRLGGPDEVYDLGFEEIFCGGAGGRETGVILPSRRPPRAGHLTERARQKS